MPAAGATAIGTARLPGQDPIDLGVCMAILKKAIVGIPVLIMIILYLIRSNIPEKSNPRDKTINNNDHVVITEQVNLTNLISQAPQVPGKPLQTSVNDTEKAVGTKEKDFKALKKDQTSDVPKSGPEGSVTRKRRSPRLALKGAGQLN